MKWQIAAALVGFVAADAKSVIRCEGSQKEVQACIVKPCAEEHRQDCVWGHWGGWGPCNCEGLQTRSRTIHQQAHNGRPCDGAKVETKSCKPQCEKVTPGTDCVWGDWSAWGACSQECGGGQQTRDRGVKVAPRHGGRLCEAHNKNEVRPCNTEPCDLGCRSGKWGAWGDWSLCSASCDQGYQFRNRVVAVTPNYCGKPVVGPETEFQRCNVEACTTRDVDCAYTAWTPWSDCSCSCNGIMDRSRRIKSYAQGAGTGCAGSLKETHPCNVGVCDTPNPVHCELTEWHDWSDCSAECGGGSRTRGRGVAVWPKNGGRPCNTVYPGLDLDLSEILAHSNTNFAEVMGRGEAAEAAAEGTGDAAVRSEIEGALLKAGLMTRNSDGTVKLSHMTDEQAADLDLQTDETFDAWMRNVAVLREVETCNSHPCKGGVDCAWAAWGEWGACTRACGTGQQTRFRHIGRMPKDGGVACVAHDNSETQECNTFPCGSVQYCAWDEWSDWSNCSQACGTGEQVRHRQTTVTNVLPRNQESILASQILDQLSGMDGVFSLEHLAFMFIGGMVCSISGLLFGYAILRRRQAAPAGHEPLIE